jgi:hypothetical protein
MTFQSILYQEARAGVDAETAEAPDFFGDLNLDQVVDRILVGRREYNLEPFYHAPLHDVEAIRYRHEVFRDLENPALFESVRTLAGRMHAMREHLAQADKLYYKYQKESWFLAAVDIYCGAVNGLVDDLSRITLRSRGFRAFLTYATGYAGSERLASLALETKRLMAALASVTYCLLIRGSTITVRKCEGETDYSADVEATFAKFKQGAARDYRVDFHEFVDMNHVEAQVLEGVAHLYPDLFARLDDYCARNRNYLDGVIAAFDREVEFYLAYLEYMAIFKRQGLAFCYPQMSAHSQEICDYAGFDLALAYKLITDNASIVCNDFRLDGRERILVVSGPNQGGKTTFARAFGQIHHLASLGCPVPGQEARLFLFDRLFTHFEREEDLQNLRGKLEDDLVRMHDILEQATSDSVIIMNEIFTSTTLQDAVFLGKKTLERIIALGALCVCVTFLDELASLGEQMVSMVSTVVPENPAQRTFKILRRPAGGLAYALSIAEKYRLTYQDLKKRLVA